MDVEKEKRRIARLEQKQKSLAGNIYDAEKELIKHSGRPRVSDHAVIRYLERVHGVNIQALRDQMLTDNDVKMIKFGCSKIKKKGCYLVIENQVVVTVL